MSDYEILKKSQKIYADDGGELLRYSLLYPELVAEESETEKIEKIEKINEFYRAIAERCERFCTDELSSYCETKRREERAYRPYSYRLACTVGYEDGECVSILISASLKRLGETGSVGEYSSAHLFSRSDGLLLPPELILKKYAPEIKNPKKYIRKNKLTSLCITEKGVSARQQGEWKALTL